MAKKVSPFADDFQNLSRTAESVVQLVKQQEESARQKAGGEQAAVREQGKPSVSASSVAVNPEGSARFPTKSEEEIQKLKKTSKPKAARTSSSKQLADWSKPVSLFNTRIPPEMAELLDDLVYQFRKKGTPRTKQDLAQEALQV